MKAARQEKQQQVQALFQKYQNAQKELEASDQTIKAADKDASEEAVKKKEEEKQALA